MQFIGSELKLRKFITIFTRYFDFRHLTRHTKFVFGFPQKVKVIEMAAIGDKEAFYTRYPCILFILYLNETFSKFCHLKLPVPIMQWCTQVLASQWATNTTEIYILKNHP